MTGDERQAILKKHLDEGAASVVHISIALAFGELALLLWVLPEYGKDLGLGPSPQAITLLGIAFPVAWLPAVFAIIFLLLVALVRALFTLKGTIADGGFEQSELRLILGRRPTAFNPFLVPCSAIEWVASAVQFAFAASFLLLPALLGFGGYLKAPGRGAAIAILGPSVVFAAAGTLAIVTLLSIMKQIGAGRGWLRTCWSISAVSAVVGIVFFYVVT